MKKKFDFWKAFIGILLLISIFFITYFISNIKPNKEKFEFSNIVNENEFINSYKVERKSKRTAIYLEINSNIFKEYNYHSYISGDGVGKMIFLQMYLISDDNKECYKIKSYCYDYSDLNDLKFIGYYYENFINNKKKYKLSIYVPETDILYSTDIEI